MYGNLFPNLSSIISEKMHGYSQFSFWILIALAKICFFTMQKKKMPRPSADRFHAYKPYGRQLLRFGQTLNVKRLICKKRSQGLELN